MIADCCNPCDGASRLASFGVDQGSTPRGGPAGPTELPAKLTVGQRDARAKFGDFLDFPVLKAVQRGDARGGYHGPQRGKPLISRGPVDPWCRPGCKDLGNDHFWVTEKNPFWMSVLPSLTLLYPWTALCGHDNILGGES